MIPMVPAVRTKQRPEPGGVVGSADLGLGQWFHAVPEEPWGCPQRPSWGAGRGWLNMWDPHPLSFSVALLSQAVLYTVALG